MPASSALIWVTASQKISSTFSLDRPTTSIFGTRPVPGAPPWRRAGRRRSTTPGGWRSRRTVRPRRCAATGRDAWRPGRAPTTPRASTGHRGRRAGPRSATPRPEQAQAGRCRCSPARTRSLRCQIDPLNAVTVAAARRDHYTVVIAASRVRCAGLQFASARWSRPTNRWPTSWQATGLDRWRGLPSVTTVRQITVEIISFLWIYLPVTSTRCFTPNPTLRKRVMKKISKAALVGGVAAAAIAATVGVASPAQAHSGYGYAYAHTVVTWGGRIHRALRRVERQSLRAGLWPYLHVLARRRLGRGPLLRLVDPLDPSWAMPTGFPAPSPSTGASPTPTTPVAETALMSTACGR